jgi:polyphosphate glucokinase
MHAQMNVLVIDVGGTHVKALVSGAQEPRKTESGPSMTAARMVKAVRRLAEGWKYDAVSIGYPGPVVHGRIATEPKNLGPGWVGFDFRAAFERPVKIVNDAAMQALGSYRGRRMLFLGLGTGLGSAMIVDGDIEPMELAHLPYRKGRTYEEYVGLAAMKRLGKRKWRKHVCRIIELLQTALEPDYVVLGGGNARKLGDKLPRGVRLGDNTNAFAGGFRLWEKSMKVAARNTKTPPTSAPPSDGPISATDTGPKQTTARI